MLTYSKPRRFWYSDRNRINPLAKKLLTRTSLVVSTVSITLLLTSCQWTRSGDHIYNANSGNVGIGIATPQSKLTVIDNSTEPVEAAEATILAQISSPYNASAVRGEATNVAGSAVRGGHFTAAGRGTGVLGEAAHEDGIGGAFFGGKWGVRGGGVKYGGWFTATGDSGVGLFARGGANGYAAQFDGKLTTKILEITGGSDLSEKFHITTVRDVIPSPGTVVIIDPHNPGKLAISSEAYDRRIAGIISGAGNVQSGVIMKQVNSAADGEYPVALSGRVYCLADTSNGSIEPGDLLTTSDIPGHAMKVTNHIKAQGAVLGKAMSRLKSGKGLVLVLVNLQ